MKFLHVTEDMLGFSPEDEQGILKLCKFFGMTEDQIEQDMFYFTNGEHFNFIIDYSNRFFWNKRD